MSPSPHGSVGVAVGEGAPFSTIDRDGDSVEDLIVIDYVEGDSDNGTTRLVSGAAVAAATPGSDVGSSATFATIPGTLVKFARIDGETPGGFERDGRLITISRTATEIVLRVGDGTGTAVLTTGPEPLSTATDIGDLKAWTSDDGPYVSLARNGDGTVEGAIYWWSLDECGAPEAPTQPTIPTTSAPAPAPIRFTG